MVFQGCSKEVSKVFLGSFKGVSRKFQGTGSVMDVSRVIHDFPKCFKKASRCFKKVHVAWHSSQLPEQKEGLFK